MIRSVLFARVDRSVFLRLKSSAKPNDAAGGVEPLLASFDLASDHLNRQRNAFRFGDVVDRHLQHPGVAQIYAADAAGEDDATKAQVVMLRYFAGATTGETAASMNLSPATVKNEWAIARAWLRDALSTGIRRPERIAPEFVP